MIFPSSDTTLRRARRASVPCAIGLFLRAGDLPWSPANRFISARFVARTLTLRLAKQMSTEKQFMRLATRPDWLVLCTVAKLLLGVVQQQSNQEPHKEDDDHYFEPHVFPLVAPDPPGRKEYTG